jgi:putative chitinase
MLITEKEFAQINPRAKDVDEWVFAINELLPAYGFTRGPRLWMFLAQCGHESAGFTIMQENLNYSKAGLLKIFRKYFDEETATRYARKPQMIANRVYANRMGNGPESSGDGWKYRGKGPIQITGSNNTKAFLQWFYADEWESIDPDCMLEPRVGIAAACWFWIVNKLNPICDTENVQRVTRIINGGTHGLDDRINRYNTIKQLLK